MKNHKEEDNVSVNEITSQNHINAVSDKPVGNAAKDPFCIYAHKRHAVGSKIIHQDGSEAVCKDDGSWQNS